MRRKEEGSYGDFFRALFGFDKDSEKKEEMNRQLEELEKEARKAEKELLLGINSYKDTPNSKGAPNPKGGGQIQLSNMQPITKQTNIERIERREEGR